MPWSSWRFSSSSFCRHRLFKLLQLFWSALMGMLQQHGVLITIANGFAASIVWFRITLLYLSVRIYVLLPITPKLIIWLQGLQLYFLHAVGFPSVRVWGNGWRIVNIEEHIAYIGFITAKHGVGYADKSGDVNSMCFLGRANNNFKMIQLFQEYIKILQINLLSPLGLGTIPTRPYM